MKKFYRSVSVLLCLVLLLNLFLPAVPALGDEGDPSGWDRFPVGEQESGTPYEVTGGTILFNKDTGSITGYEGEPETLVIPAEIDDTAVTRIAPHAFAGCSTLTAISIADSVTSIANHAFNQCVALADLKLPAALVSIGEYAFTSCVSLQEIDFPEGIERIEYWSFGGCGFTSLTIPASTKYWGISSFIDNLELVSVTIEEGVRYIPPSAFQNCEKLAEVHIPDSVTEIEQYAFWQCYDLLTLTIPASVTKISSSAFERDYGLILLDLTLKVAVGSYAEQYAISKGLQYETAAGEDIIIFDGHRYQRIDEGMTWTEAKEYCESLGGHLVTITSAEEQMAVQELIRVGKQKQYWLGASDAAEEGVWQWVTGEPWDYTNWATYQPDNYRGLDHYLQMLRLPNPKHPSISALGDWNDTPDDNCLPAEEHFFATEHVGLVCEWEGIGAILNLTLPPDTLALYDGLTLTLKDHTTGSHSSITVRESSTYQTSVMLGHTYSATLYNKYGSPISESASFTAEEQNNITLPALQMPRKIQITVKDAAGIDVSGQARIIWQDGQTNQTLWTGASISQLIDGHELAAHIMLDNTLAMHYQMPEPLLLTVSGDHDHTVTLQPYTMVEMRGTVTDSTTGQPLASAAVTFSQALGSSSVKNTQVLSGADGTFTASIANAAYTLTISKPGYLNTTLQKTPAEGAALGEIALAPISGPVIDLEIGYTASVLAGEAAAQRILSATGNDFVFALYNQTQNTPIEHVSLQYPQIILGDGAVAGDLIRITLSSHANDFAPQSAEITLGSDGGKAVFQLSQNGRIMAVATGGDQPQALIYNSEGRLLQTRPYLNGSTVTTPLPAGDYTLISMSQSSLFNQLQNLADLTAVGLAETNDYTRRTVTVKPGVIESVEAGSIPALDETKLVYLQEGSITANKTTLKAGQSLLMRAQFSLQDAYLSAATDHQLVVELPEYCELIPGSVLAGKRAAVYSLDGRTLTISLQNSQELVHFYVAPRQDGDYAVNAFASFALNGQTMRQPLGAAHFDVTSLELHAPSLTARTSIPLYGSAPAGSTVTIYDHEAVIAQTVALANGFWQCEVELYHPDQNIYHDITARVTAENGSMLSSPTQTVTYDPNSNIVPSKVTMYNTAHGPTSLNLIEYASVFDFLSPGKRPIYWYWPQYPAFTFAAEFTINDPALVKDVVLNVHMSDKTVERLPAVFVERKGVWAATYDTGNSYRLPVNVTVDYRIERISPVSADFAGTSGASAAGDTVRGNTYAGSDLSTEIEMLPALQTGSIYTGTITYRNAGNTEIAMPTYYLQGENLVVGEPETDVLYDNCAWWASNGEDGKAVLAPGDSGQITFRYKALQDGPFRLDVSAMAANDTRYSRVTMLGLENCLDEFGEEEEGGTSSASTLMMAHSFATAGVEGFVETCSNPNCSCGSSCGMPPSLYAPGIETWKNGAGSNLEFGANRKRTNKETGKTEIYPHEGLDFPVGDREGKTGAGTPVTALSDGKVVHKGNFGGDTGYVVVETVVDGVKWCLLYGEIGPSVQVGDTVKTGDVIGSLVSNTFKNPYYRAGVHLEVYVGSWSEVNKSGKRDKSLLYDPAYFLNAMALTVPPCQCEAEEPPAPDAEFVLDPSGYVYEAVESNRLAGITATIFYQENDQAVFWDAAGYQQENPLITDSNGMYAWDVPLGNWQVRYDLEGFQTAYSDWLPVPPPQLDVNIGMTSYTAPEIAYINAYHDGVEIVFSKYMKAADLTATHLTLAIGGEAIPINAAPEIELAPDGTSLARTVWLYPENGSLTSPVTVSVSGLVESYAHVALANDFSAEYPVDLRPQTLEVQNINLRCGEESTITVKVSPQGAAAGKTLSAHSAMGSVVNISPSAIVNANGEASFTVSGQLPGTAAIMFALEDTPLSKTVAAAVALETDPEVQTFTVTFVLNGGTHTGGGALVQTISAGGAALAPTVTRDGYTFNGWDKTFNHITESITVTAQWKAQETSQPPGGTSSSPVKVPEVDEPTTPTTPLPTETWTNPYGDVADAEWFYEAVRFVTQNGLMNGTGNAKFSPQTTITRTMLVTMLYRQAGSPAVEGSINYSDVKSGEWYSNAILWASQHKIINGYADGRFGINDPVTREQAVTILYRYAQEKGLDVSAAEDLSGYSDASAVSAWALPAVRWAVAAKIIQGRTATTIVPQGTSTRAEAAMIFKRYIEDYLNK